MYNCLVRVYFWKFGRIAFLEVSRVYKNYCMFLFEDILVSKVGSSFVLDWVLALCEYIFAPKTFLDDVFKSRLFCLINV